MVNYFFTEGLNYLSNISSGITFHGPSGYTAFFSAKSGGTFNDAPGLNASISPTGNGTYTIVFHKSGEQLVFNNYGSLLVDCDQNNNCLSPNYNGHGDLTQITDTQNRNITFQQNSDHQVTSFTDSTNRTVKQGYTYNTPGGGLWLSSITNANNETTNYTYNTQDQVMTITDPLNNKTTFTYTTSGQVATITDANNGLTRFTYDASNNSACSGLASPAEPCTVVTDPNGHTTTYAYNGNLQVNAALDALGHLTSSTVNALTYNVTASTDALSSQSSYNYDNNNDLLSETDGSKASTTFTYPSSINGSQAQNVLYQPLTQTTAVNSNTNSVTNYQYDNNGNVLSSIDKASNHGSSYTYNADGTASSMTDGDTNVTLYGYDTNGNLTTDYPSWSGR